MYFNPPVWYDIESAVGYLAEYIDPKYCSGFMMAEHLPYHSREYKLDMNMVVDYTNKNPTATYVSCSLANRGFSSANAGGHVVLKGNLYFYPYATGNLQNGVFKFDIFCYIAYQQSGSTHWFDRKLSCVEDSSFRVTNGSIGDTAIPNPSIYAYHSNTSRNVYFYIRFNPPTVGTIQQCYGRYLCSFIPELIGGYSLTTQWQFVGPQHFV